MAFKVQKNYNNNNNNENFINERKFLFILKIDLLYHFLIKYFFKTFENYIIFLTRSLTLFDCHISCIYIYIYIYIYICVCVCVCVCV